jgi:hypothetical protein
MDPVIALACETVVQIVIVASRNRRGVEARRFMVKPARESAMRFGTKPQVELSGPSRLENGVNVCLLTGQLVSDATETKVRIEGGRYCTSYCALRDANILFVAFGKSP